MTSRYHRQEIVIGKEGQQKLLASNVVIVGVGALGTQAATLLARAGVGHITLIDRDTIEENNLQRQMLFTEKDIGKPKASQAAVHVKEINSTISVIVHDKDCTQENINDLIPKETDLILDGTDNLETRFLLNDYAIKHNIPWIYAAAIQSRAVLMNILPEKACFQCIIKEPTSLETCDTAGILNTTTALIATIQVNEAIKILLNNNPAKELLQINLQNNTIEKIKTKKRDDCNACNKTFLFLEHNNTQDIMKFCSTGNYQIRFQEKSLQELKNKLQHENVEDHKDFLKLKNMLIFKDRCLIKATSEKEARSLFAKYIGA